MDACKTPSYTLRSIKKWQRSIRKKAIEKLGGKCAQCGFTDPRALQIDHVLGTDEKSRKRGATLCRAVLEDQNGEYQLLCANCNWIKRAENNENRGYRQLLTEFNPAIN